MVRVAELKRHVPRRRERRGARRPHPGGNARRGVRTGAHELGEEQHHCFLDELQPLLAAEGIRLVRPKDVTVEQERFLDDYFRRTLLPVVTPLAIDPGHPFPYLGQPLALPHRVAAADRRLAAARTRRSP